MLEENVEDTEWVILNIQATGTTILLQYLISSIMRLKHLAKLKKILSYKVNLSIIVDR
jgi:hypothetical protein